PECRLCKKEGVRSGKFTNACEGIQECDEAFRVEAGIPGILDAELVRLPLIRSICANECTVDQDSQSLKSIIHSIVGSCAAHATSHQSGGDLNRRYKHFRDCGTPRGTGGVTRRHVSDLL